MTSVEDHDPVEVGELGEAQLLAVNLQQFASRHES